MRSRTVLLAMFAAAVPVLAPSSAFARSDSAGRAACKLIFQAAAPTGRTLTTAAKDLERASTKRARKVADVLNKAARKDKYRVRLSADAAARAWCVEHHLEPVPPTTTGETLSPTTTTLGVQPQHYAGRGDSIVDLPTPVSQPAIIHVVG